MQGSGERLQTEGAPRRTSTLCYPHTFPAPDRCQGPCWEAGMGYRGDWWGGCGEGGAQGNMPSMQHTKAAPNHCGPQRQRPFQRQPPVGALVCLDAYMPSHKNCPVSGDGSAYGLGTLPEFQTLLSAYGNTSSNVILLKCMHCLHVHFIENRIFIYIYMSTF